MTKTNTIYACTNCDAQYSKWSGRCQECGKWSTLEESIKESAKPKGKQDIKAVAAKTTSLKDVNGEDASRVKTEIGELDRVLGGGLVPGSFILLGGEPGIGKSTLSLQLSTIVKNSLYISGEESISQVKLRSDRLGLSSDSLELANETMVEKIISTIKEKNPTLAVIDSIQTIYSTDLPNEPGNISQVRACTAKLLDTAKSTGTSIIIIGHVTKEGNVAGPRTLEHLVDTVLYLEGDRYQQIRFLRAVKNRFGSTDEIGLFEMDNNGLKEVSNPSELLLEERGANMPGSVVTCLMEGSRPLLVEVQALVSATSFGFPVRKASGFDLNRLHVLIAVLQKRAGVDLSQADVHVNIVGGIKANEPAADLAVCLAIISACKDKALASTTVSFGEVGLGGEIRSVRFTEKRIKECESLGMKRVVTRLQKGMKYTKKVPVINDFKEIVELLSVFK